MKPEKTGRRCVLILLILLAAVFFLSFLLGRYRVSALQTARLLADRALSGVSRGHLRLAPTWTPEPARAWRQSATWAELMAIMPNP